MYRTKWFSSLHGLLGFFNVKPMNNTLIQIIPDVGDGFLAVYFDCEVAV